MLNFSFTVRKYKKKRIFSKKMCTFAQIIEKDHSFHGRKKS